MPVNIAVIDVETTGLSPYRDEVIELSVLLAEYDAEKKRLVAGEQYSGRREPGRPIHPGAAAVHGITMQQLKGQRLDLQAMQRLIGAAQLIVAHNARFDRPFVLRVYPMANEKPWYCSMAGIDWRGRGYSSRGLQYLLARHGIHPGRAHSASGDVVALSRLLSNYIYLDELLGKPPAYLPVLPEAAATRDADQEEKG